MTFSMFSRKQCHKAKHGKSWSILKLMLFLCQTLVSIIDGRFKEGRDFPKQWNEYENKFFPGFLEVVSPYVRIIIL